VAVTADAPSANNPVSREAGDPERPPTANYAANCPSMRDSPWLVTIYVYVDKQV